MRRNDLKLSSLIEIMKIPAWKRTLSINYTESQLYDETTIKFTKSSLFVDLEITYICVFTVCDGVATFDKSTWSIKGATLTDDNYSPVEKEKELHFFDSCAPEDFRAINLEKEFSKLSSVGIKY